VRILAGFEAEASQNKTWEKFVSKQKPGFMNLEYPENLELFLEQEIPSSDKLWF